MMMALGMKFHVVMMAPNAEQKLLRLGFTQSLPSGMGLGPCVWLISFF
jgi:hypothetical protein